MTRLIYVLFPCVEMELLLAAKNVSWEIHKIVVVAALKAVLAEHIILPEGRGTNAYGEHVMNRSAALIMIVRLGKNVMAEFVYHCPDVEMEI